MTVTIYHNPRCSKSRQTLELIRSQGHEPRVIEYLENPPSQQELEQILLLLGCGARDLMRSNESEYRQQGLDDPALSNEQLISAMLEYPILIQRPIVLANGKAAVGRPPENVLEIL